MATLLPANPRENLLPCDGELYDFGLIDLPDDMSDSDLYQYLLTTLPWQADIVTLFGKTHVTKRQTVWMGDEGLSYRYSGHTRLAHHWDPIVFHVKRIAEQQLQKQGLLAHAVKDQAVDDDSGYFNACLLNYYPSGDEGMGYHADDEKELGDCPVIAALSLGATRKMRFKHQTNTKTAQLFLSSGQLMVMAGVMQQYWKHSIPKSKKVSTGRISLTFRRIQTV